MGEWTERLIAGDRKNEPDNIDGMFYTDAPILLFKFINQQITVVQATAYSKVWTRSASDIFLLTILSPTPLQFIAGIFEESLIILNKFQQSIQETLRSTLPLKITYSCSIQCLSLL